MRNTIIVECSPWLYSFAWWGVIGCRYLARWLVGAVIAFAGGTLCTLKEFGDGAGSQLIRATWSISITMYKLSFMSRFNFLFSTSWSVTRFRYAALTNIITAWSWGRLHHCLAVQGQNPNFSVLQHRSCVEQGCSVTAVWRSWAVACHMWSEEERSLPSVFIPINTKAALRP